MLTMAAPFRGGAGTVCESLAGFQVVRSQTNSLTVIAWMLRIFHLQSANGVLEEYRDRTIVGVCRYPSLRTGYQ
jgi:hypothetical protein